MTLREAANELHNNYPLASGVCPLAALIRGQMGPIIEEGCMGKHGNELSFPIGTIFDCALHIKESNARCNAVLMDNEAHIVELEGREEDSDKIIAELEKSNQDKQTRIEELTEAAEAHDCEEELYGS